MTLKCLTVVNELFLLEPPYKHKNIVSIDCVHCTQCNYVHKYFKYLRSRAATKQLWYDMCTCMVRVNSFFFILGLPISFWNILRENRLLQPHLFLRGSTPGNWSSRTWWMLELESLKMPTELGTIIKPFFGGNLQCLSVLLCVLLFSKTGTLSEYCPYLETF